MVVAVVPTPRLNNGLDLQCHKFNYSKCVLDYAASLVSSRTINSVYTQCQPVVGIKDEGPS